MLNHNLSFVQKGNNCGCSVHNSRDREMLHAFCFFALFLSSLHKCVRACTYARICVYLWSFSSYSWVHSQPGEPVHPFLLVINKVKPNRRLIDAKTDHF